MNSAIDVLNVTKMLGGGGVHLPWLQSRSKAAIPAVNDVSFAVSEKQIFGLVGPNGAGKTTLIKLLCTLLLPTSGSIRICGLDTTTHEREIRSLVGLVTSNERSFYWRLTGRQNLQFFADLYRVERSAAKAWIDTLLEFLDLAEHADQPFGTYSTGTKQRFALARGLLSKPRILLMDEPTKGVDPVNASEITTLIRDRLFALWRPTVLITSHNLREIELLCERVAIMHHGHMIACGTIDELRDSASANETYQLVLSGIDKLVIESILVSHGVECKLSQSTYRHDCIDVQINLDPHAMALDAILRDVMRAGGSLVNMKSSAAPFEGVFLTLINNADWAKPGSSSAAAASPLELTG